MNFKTIRTVFPVVFGPTKSQMTTLTDSHTQKLWCELLDDPENRRVRVRDRRVGTLLFIPYNVIACMEPSEHGSPDSDAGKFTVGPRTVTKTDDTFVDTRLTDLEPKAKHGKKRAA